MTYPAGPEAYLGRTVVGPQAAKIGSVGQVYVNDESSRPDWVTVNTGLFGMRDSFTPLAGSSLHGDERVLPYGKAVVKDARPTPRTLIPRSSGRCTPITSSSWAAAAMTGATKPLTWNAGPGFDTGAGFDTSGPTTDEAMIRSEERLNVGRRQGEVGRARLRRYVVTEQ
jgi:hypothetical protein